MDKINIFDLRLGRDRIASVLIFNNWGDYCMSFSDSFIKNVIVLDRFIGLILIYVGFVAFSHCFIYDLGALTPLQAFVIFLTFSSAVITIVAGFIRLITGGKL